MIKSFPTTPPPHLRCPHSAKEMTWRFFFALLPVWIVLLAHRPLEILKISFFVFTFSVLIEAAACFLSKKKIDFKDGSAALWALLLALMIPGNTGFGGLFLAVLAAVFLGKEFYGGRSGVWLHPSWLGAAFLAVSFPQTGFPGSGPFSFWNPFMDLWSALITLALLTGGIFLTAKKNISWEVPLIYLVLVFIPCQLMGIHTTLSLPAILLNAFWILPEPAASPCSRRGRVYFSFAAALLTLVLDLLSVPAAPVFAALLPALFIPWMDEWILPGGISFEARTRGSEML